MQPWTLLLVVLAAGLAGLAVTTVVLARRYAAAHPAGGRFVPVTGGRLHVLERPAPGAGHDGAPAVVLLHGASGNARDMIEALGAHIDPRYRVLAFDRPGHGWSDRPGGAADAAPARQAQLVREALDALGVERAVIVGHSWSGALATRFALDHPGKVAGLVLLGPVTHPWPGGVTWYYTPAAHPLAAGLFTRLVSAPVGALSFAKAVSGVFAPDAAPADYASRTGAWLVLRPHEFRANAEDVFHLHGHVSAQYLRYDEIRVPTSVIHGAKDNTVSPTIHSRAIARQIAGARLILLPEGGHMPHHAYPDLVAAEIDRVARAAEASPPDA